MEYGYVRVSSKEQNIDRQFLVMERMIPDERNIFIDKHSGKDFERPAYQQLLRRLKTGDVVFIKSIDRLGRNYGEIIEQWRVITKVKGADIFVVDFPLLDTRKKADNDLTGTLIADLVLQILSYVAQTEREFIRRRQAEGIAAARAKGSVLGRRQTALPKNFKETALRCRRKEITVDKGAQLCKMSKSTFYKHFRQFDEN